MQKKQLAQEYPPASEAAVIGDLAERLKQKIIEDNPTGIMRRDAHPKMHGVVKAEFTVEPDLPPELRVGVFSEPRTYQAWIRFSNQFDTINPDSTRDIRGMAIKLMGVPGEKLLDAEKYEQTHDFIRSQKWEVAVLPFGAHVDDRRSITAAILNGIADQVLK